MPPAGDALGNSSFELSLVEPLEQQQYKWEKQKSEEEVKHCLNATIGQLSGGQIAKFAQQISGSEQSGGSILDF